MKKKEALQLFEQREVRTVWDDKEEKWYFSIIDVVAVLTGTDRVIYDIIILSPIYLSLLYLQ